MLNLLSVKCPFCESILSKVVDKRAVLNKGEIRRRRQCLKCSKRFTTYESLARLQVLVVKKSGRREPFNLEKLRAGIAKALEKRPSLDRAQMLADKIESILRDKGKKEIPSSTIGKLVLAQLKKIDGVAYLRFASVYRTFQDPKDFINEVKSLN